MYVKISDIKIYYIEKGNGFPLILLHGNGEKSDYFKKQIEFFCKKFRVIAIDTRGHGNSERGEKPFKIRQFAEDIYEFMKEKGIIKANILGFSDGANIALCFALKYPQMIEKLILNGADLFPQGVKKTIQIPIEIGYKITCLFSKKSHNAKRKAEMLGLMVNDPYINPTELQNLNVKTLVIAGSKDMIKEEHTKLIYKSLPDAKLSIIPGNHFIADKNPKLFNSEVNKFLEE